MSPGGVVRGEKQTVVRFALQEEERVVLPSVMTCCRLERAVRWGLMLSGSVWPDRSAPASTSAGILARPWIRSMAGIGGLILTRLPEFRGLHGALPSLERF